ncbi:hypothetical protein K501DRAFT_210751 [Backusella circina FSU 941]|nr:hypothetical protein K501DRAFT_210751 [Backusella circina FSU 941]
MSAVSKPRVSIEYCPKCRWMMRAAWMGQELLTTFENEIGELALIPGDSAVFTVKAGDVVVWDRKLTKRFPEMKELKQLVRDVIAPEKALGHSDRKKTEQEDCKTCPKE